MTAVPAHEIIVIDPVASQDGWETLRQQCHDVRINVFHHEQGFPLDVELDESVSLLPAFVLRLTY